jgi:pimeloyl-ACP methyl ester carboxylesterase
MASIFRRFGAVALLALSAAPPAHGQEAAADRAPHAKRFVQVNGARLEVLDFGGRGPLLIFLPGFRNSAHVFDDLAPEFTDRFHVVALTPRGVPVSNAPASGYTIEQLAADVRTLMDSLGARSVILAGHSIAGAIMTRFGEAYPSRLTAAIYLDASFDYASAVRRSQRTGRPVPSDTTSAQYEEWVARYSEAAWSPSVAAAASADRAGWDIDSADVEKRLALTDPLRTEVRSRPHEPWKIKAPAIAFCAVPGVHRAIGWLTPDYARWNEAKAFYDADKADRHAECQRFAERDHHATVIEVDSGHYVFFDQRNQVAREMRRFLNGVSPQ